MANTSKTQTLYQRLYKWWVWKADAELVALIVAAVLLSALAILLVSHSNARWEQFVEQHDCKIIARHKGTSTVGIGADGKMVSLYTRGTVTWRCNDGVDYTR